ncbi:29483_t:CDS:2, partial [Gigaspora margarita]
MKGFKVKVMLDYWKFTKQSNFAKKCKAGNHDEISRKEDEADEIEVVKGGYEKIVEEKEQRMLAEDDKETNKEKNTRICEREDLDLIETEDSGNCYRNEISFKLKENKQKSQLEKLKKEILAGNNNNKDEGKNIETKEFLKEEAINYAYKKWNKSNCMDIA